MQVFVPGRICLFGEHSDWAGAYRRINADIEKGYTLVTGTNQGLYAEVNAHPDKLIVKTTLDDGTRVEPVEMEMDPKILLAEAEKGDFYSYAAGTAYQILTHYQVQGLEIDNYKTDLPVKKGLSSSAAVCVLVARAFNQIYDLKMTTRGEMEYAYLGEITTPSRCGRMDQACAYGNRPVYMSYDGDRIDVEEFSIPNDLYFIIVDLAASKDTREILAKLNQCYPFAEDALQKKVHEYLGPINRRIVRVAREALKIGDAEKIGKLMTEAQALFDKHLGPACPSQLTSPVLHKVLALPSIQPYILGGKGVGSQGDGTAQFIVRNCEDQRKVMSIIEEELNMPCLSLVIGSGQRVRKAVIPAAGFGTRVFPASHAVKKELFPVMDSDGILKPAIMIIIEEAIEAGIEEVALIVQDSDRNMFEDFFCRPPSIENFNKLSIEDQKRVRHLQDIGRRITFIPQKSQEGFGHAVYCAKEWVGNEPFLLMLGDHLYSSGGEQSCARQLLDVYHAHKKSVVGLKPEPGEKIGRFGCATGQWEDPDALLSITTFAEKPKLEFAREHLALDSLPEDHYLTVFGQYVLTPEIFIQLDDQIKRQVREGGEFQLTSCMEALRRQEGFLGYMIHGERYDIGNPEAYRETLYRFGGA